LGPIRSLSQDLWAFSLTLKQVQGVENGVHFRPLKRVADPQLPRMVCDAIQTKRFLGECGDSDFIRLYAIAAG